MSKEETGRSEIVDVHTSAGTFPLLSSPIVEREHLLETIETMFEAGSQLVAVEGEEGIGKTTLLAQFALRHPGNTVALFLRAGRGLSSDPWYWQFDLCNQVEWLVKKRFLDPQQDSIDAVRLRILLTQLQGRARWDGAPYYFVIDGIEDVASEGESLRNLVFEMLPLGIPGFRFLLSGDLSSLPSQELRSVKCRAFPVTKFSLDETMKYFADFSLTLEQATELRNICQGIPLRLASIKRIVEGGKTIESLIEDAPTQLAELLEYEWIAAYQPENEIQNTLLAVLAHDRARHTIQSLTELCGCHAELIRSIVSPIRFLQIYPDTDEVSFISDAFRTFAARQLQDRKVRVSNLIIEHLSAAEDSANSLTKLPGYLAEAERFEQLFGYLTSQHLVQMMRYSHSMRPAMQSVELGLNAAYQMHHDAEVARLSMSSALICQLGREGAAPSEIEARVALHDYDAAIALAQSAVLKEDRLHLLSVVAQSYILNKEAPPLEIVEQLKQLVSEVDATLLGNRAVEIASELILLLPEQAIAMVEESASSPGGKQGLDEALTVLSIRTMVAREVLGVEASGTLEAEKQISARMKDSRARGVLGSLSAVMGGQSAKETLAKLGALGQARDEVFLLQLWARANRKREDAHEVVSYALKRILTSADYSPNAGIYRDLAEPLPYIVEPSLASYLIGQLDSQKDLIEQQGPTQDYVRLQLLLVKAEARYDEQAARNRLFEVYVYAAERTDLTVRAEGLAWLVSTLKELKQMPSSKPALPLLSEADSLAMEQELEGYVQGLLAATADHYEVTKGIIEALAQSAHHLALRIAKSLNTEDRRDQAICDVVEIVASQARSASDAEFLREAMQQIMGYHARDYALGHVLQRLSDRARRASFPIEEYLDFIQKSEHVQASEARCKALCLGYKALKTRMQAVSSAITYESMANHLLDKMQSAWDSIDVGWLRVEIGYEIAETLSKADEAVARQYLSSADALRNEMSLDSGSAAQAYGTCLSLAVRTFAGLLPQRLDSETDFLRLASLIDAVPSNGERAAKWAELALLSYARRRADLAMRIVAEHVKPLLEDVEGGPAYRNAVIQAVAPALWQFHTETARTLIDSVPFPDREDVLREVAAFILRRMPSHEPYSVNLGEDACLEYESLVDLCIIAEQLQTDSNIYWLVDEICRAVITGRRHGKYRRDQQRTVFDRLKAVISKLPDTKNIRHEGYKVIAEAQLMRAEPSRYRKGDWNALISRARMISNEADRAYVIAVVAVTMPSEVGLSYQLLNEAREVAANIPSILDRAKRLMSLASAIVESDYAERFASEAKHCLEAAMELACRLCDGSSREAQRQMIDIAYSFNEALAESLASKVNDAHAHVKEQLGLLRARKEITKLSTSQTTNIVVLTQEQQRLYSQAAWMSLHELATKVRDLARADQIRNVLWLGGHFPLREAGGLLAWSVEQCVARFAYDARARANLYPLFTAASSVTEMAREMIAVSFARAKKVKSYQVNVPQVGSTGLVLTGNREGAFRYLRAWFEENAQDYVKICDPFFGPEELEWIRVLSDVQPDCSIVVLTSRKHQSHTNVAVPWEDTYNMYWRRRVSDQDPPDTEIVVVGTQSHGEPPIHDRWVLTKGAGLALGTSLNSLGISKDSKVTELTPEEAVEAEQRLDSYITRSLRTHRSEKLQYTTFNLISQPDKPNQH